MLVGVALLPLSFQPSGTQAFYSTNRPPWANISDPSVHKTCSIQGANNRIYLPSTYDMHLLTTQSVFVRNIWSIRVPNLVSSDSMYLLLVDFKIGGKISKCTQISILLFLFHFQPMIIYAETDEIWTFNDINRMSNKLAHYFLE